jgi:hypothetical protein
MAYASGLNDAPSLTSALLYSQLRQHRVRDKPASSVPLRYVESTPSHFGTGRAFNRSLWTGIGRTMALEGRVLFNLGTL